MKIAVVIPVLDESDRISGTLEALAAGAGSAEMDVVVVDGGSRDSTPDLARAHGARVFRSAPGRARQLQLGLEQAAGETVLFLHADTRMPAGWANAVTRALAREDTVGGSFAFAFGSDGAVGTAAGLRAVEWGARVRSRKLGLPYGDQAVFARRSALEAIGGVPQAEWMEDLDLVVRLRRLGRLAPLSLPVQTSARRYREAGVVSTVVRHFLATLGWLTGAPRSALRRSLSR